jgi:phosphomannomutase
MQCDKDAVAATLLICEVAAQSEKEVPFYKELLQLYVEHGFYKEYLVSITKKE